MQDFHTWLIAGLALCIAEMLSGTFFLLVLGLAALAGAVTGWLGGGLWLQCCVAAVFAVIGVIAVHHYRQNTKAKKMPSFDIGQPVSFERWISQNDGMARVNYRGTTWDARVAAGQNPAPGGILYITASEGSLLCVSETKP